jgi:RimJ/RimL family protein N-acetyltransferase
VRLRAATAADFGFIRGLTTHPDYAPFIGDDDEGQLALWLADPAVQVLIWEDARQAGFAIFREIGNASGRVELFRLALGRIGGGLGHRFVAALVDHGFGALGAARLWLDASGENLRAQNLYRTAGFVEEGRLRQHWYRPCLGRNVDLVYYGMLRQEWEARG